MIQEESDSEIVYRIPTLKLNCSIEVFDYVLCFEKTIGYRDGKLVLFSMEMDWYVRNKIGGVHDVPPVEAFYYTNLYNMYRIEWYSDYGYSGEKQLPLIEYLDSELEGVNIFEFLNGAYDFGLGTLVPYCYQIAVEGKLSDRVIQDLIEYIPTFINMQVGGIPFIGWKDREDIWAGYILNLLDFVDEESIDGLTYSVVNHFEESISDNVYGLIKYIEDRGENPRYQFLLDGLHKYLASIPSKE